MKSWRKLELLVKTQKLDAYIVYTNRVGIPTVSASREFLLVLLGHLQPIVSLFPASSAYRDATLCRHGRVTASIPDCVRASYTVMTVVTVRRHSNVRDAIMTN